MARKTYRCERCGKEVLIRSHGLCQACRSKELPKKVPSKVTLSKKKKVVGKSDNLSDFFRMMLEELCSRKMSDTGKPIFLATVCNVCHILPKRWYKSVATERRNIVFLCSDEHTMFDQHIDRMEFDELEQKFPFVWKFAVKRVVDMYNEGLIKERGRLLTEILDRYS